MIKNSHWVITPATKDNSAVKKKEVTSYFDPILTITDFDEGYNKHLKEALSILEQISIARQENHPIQKSLCNLRNDLSGKRSANVIISIAIARRYGFHETVPVIIEEKKNGNFRIKIAN